MESVASAAKKFIIGTLIGIASTVPGVSGAIIAVCFGVYERLIADLADLFHKIKEDLAFIVLIGGGILFGMVAIAFGLDFIMDNYVVAAMLLFLGLIGGQLPELWNLTEPSVKISKTNAAAFIIGLAITICLLFLGTSEDKVLTHDLVSYGYMFLVGILFSVSKLAPGISGSTVLLALGLFAPLMHIVTTFDLLLLIPAGLGLVVGLLGFAKVVNYALTKYRKSTYLMIFGLTIGSMFIIFKEAAIEYVGIEDLLLGAVALVVGILLSMWFTRLGKKTSKEFALE